MNEGYSSSTKVESDQTTKKKKGLKKLDQKIVEDEEFNIYGLGEIRYAKLHGEANRPLFQLTEELDSEIQKCPCCNFPAPDEKKIKLRPYTTCDDPDDFSICGQGVVLYYSFIKYIIVNLLIVGICISCFNMYYNFRYYKELEKVCNDLNSDEVTDKDIKDICDLYISEADEYVDATFFQFSSVNIKDYRELFKKITEDSDGTFESSIINISRMNFCCIILVFIFNLVFIYFLFNKSNAADYLVFTVSDYSIFLCNLYDVHKTFIKIQKDNQLPENENEKIRSSSNNENELEKFKTFLKEKICLGPNGETFIINRIDFCYKLEKLAELQKKYEYCQELIAEIEYDPKVKKQNKKDGLEGDDRKYIATKFLCCKEEKKLADINKEKDELEKKINELIEDSRKNTANYFGGGALITFDSIREQELYLKNLPNNFIEYFFQFLRNMAYIFCSCCFNVNDINYLKRNIKFEAAPEPEDIIFENLETSPFAKIMRTTLVYIISIIICAVSFAIIVVLNYVQVSKLDQSDNNDLLLYILSLVITAVTSGIDFFLEIVLKTLTEIEKQATKTDFSLSYSIKLTLFTFLNSALLPLFSEIVINQSDSGYKILISNMLMKFLVNAFVTPIMWTMNVGFFMKKIQIWFIERKIKSEENLPEEEKTFDKNQKELNELYELPPMNVELKYSYIMKTLLMSFLYIPIFPLGVLISLIGILLGYWLEKFNFANMYKRPEMLNRQIAECYVKYFVLVLFVFGIGDYIFLSDAYETRIWSLINIILFGVLIIIPYPQLLSIDSLEVDESSFHKQKYDEAYVNFYIDYERANPMTQKEGSLKYQKALKDKGLIKAEEYEKNIMNIRNANPMFINRGRRGFGGGNQNGGGFFSPYGPHGPFGFYGPHGGFFGPHGGFFGPHGGFNGPHGGFNGPHGGFNGPHGGFNGPHGDFNGPHGDFNGPHGDFNGPHGPNFNIPASNQDFNRSQTNRQNLQKSNTHLTMKENNTFNQQIPPSNVTTINIQPSQGFYGGNNGPNNNFILPSQGFSGGNNGPTNNFIPPSQGFPGGNNFIPPGYNMGPHNNFMPNQIPPGNP